MMKRELSNIHKFFDGIGICVSTLCLIHCLLLPLLLLSYPLFFAHSHQLEEDLHFYFAILVSISALFVIYPHCKKTGKREIAVLAAIGTALVLFALGQVNGHHHLWDIVLTSLGSLLLLTAHYKNIRIRHEACTDKKSPCSNHH